MSRFHLITKKYIIIDLLVLALICTQIKIESSEKDVNRNSLINENRVYRYYLESYRSLADFHMRDRIMGIQNVAQK
jgi:hypothetical protein